jgi:acid phosphatase
MFMLMMGTALRHRASVLAALSVTAVLWLSACAPSSRVPNIFDVQQRVALYISSGQYDADVARVAGSARAYVDQRAGKVTRPAIVLDIDETALSNWPAYKANGWVRIVNGGCDLETGPCGLRTWQERGQLKPIGPTLELARHAKSIGVAVFFITGRPSYLRDATERNLREAGYEWDDVVLLTLNATPPHVKDFKAPERRKIADRGYTILLSMGDQESDLDGGYAERTFKLPNPVYFIP